MKLKAGDRLLCKKTDGFNFNLYYIIKDKYYIVNNFCNNNGQICGENNKLWLFTNDIKYDYHYIWYIWEYFYTPSEVRKMKLEKLFSRDTKQLMK